VSAGDSSVFALDTRYGADRDRRSSHFELNRKAVYESWRAGAGFAFPVPVTAFGIRRPSTRPTHGKLLMMEGDAIGRIRPGYRRPPRKTP